MKHRLLSLPFLMPHVHVHNQRAPAGFDPTIGVVSLSPPPPPPPSPCLSHSHPPSPPSSPHADARAVARRVLAWGALLGGALGVAQILGLPLLGAFTPLPEVRKAARLPSVIGAFLQLINGVVFVGEGLMVAAGAFGSLAKGQVAATAAFLLALQLAPKTLVNVWLCFRVFNGVRLLNFIKFFWFDKSPLMPEGREGMSA